MEPVADALCHLIADVIFREAAEGVGIVKGLPAFVAVKKPHDLHEPAVFEQIAQVAGTISHCSCALLTHVSVPSTSPLEVERFG
jgi:hypothetical protein